MEKSGPGSHAPRPLIIERPDLQSPPQRVVSAGLTVFFWALWAYLWLPVFALLGWAFGVSRFYDEMFARSGGQAVLELIGWYGLVIAVLAGSLVGWALYNIARFRGGDRRTAAATVAVAQVAERAGVDADTLLDWQRARVLHVRHDDAGRIEAVEAFPFAGRARPQPAREREPLVRDTAIN